MKKTLTIIGFLIAAILIIVLCKNNFSLFSRKDTPLATISFKGKIVDIWFVQSEATTRDVIQIISITKDGKKRILKNIENNNFLVGYSVINDSTLRVVVNKVGHFINKPDTVEVIISNH